MDTQPGANVNDIEGADPSGQGVGDYPIDSLLIRSEARTIFEVVRRIGQKFFIMDPEFQRDFIWDVERQSRLIESVLMRIPLPVIYVAEDAAGKLVVVDGLQRLTTFDNFLNNKTRLSLSNKELNGKLFKELSPKLQNRIEDTQLILYLIDSKVPERARLDIFERVNGGVPLSRQQMRNALYQGAATQLLKECAQDPLFLQATGNSLDAKQMRDREAVNRFCAFELLGPQAYRDDMDQFLADALIVMNRRSATDLALLRRNFQRSMHNNLLVFGPHAFRKHEPGLERRKTFNMSLFDVFSTGLVPYEEAQIQAHRERLRDGFFALLQDGQFQQHITIGTSDGRRVRGRFESTRKLLTEVFGA